MAKATALNLNGVLEIRKSEQQAMNQKSIQYFALEREAKQSETLYNLALKLGGTDEGLPGQRHGVDYYAYFRDLDGNKICAFAAD